MVKRRNRLLSFVLAAVMIMLTLPLSSVAETMQVLEKKGADFSENTYIAGQIQLLLDRLVYSDTPYFTVMGHESCQDVACDNCRLSDVSAKHPALKDLGVTFDTAVYGSGAFARYAFALIFGTKLQAINFFGNTVANIPLQVVGRAAAERSAGTPVVGVSGKYEVMNGENLKKIFKNGTPGDLIQARSASGGNHTMIFLSASDTTVMVLHSIDYGVEGIEKNKVVISEMSYDEMIGYWGNIITLFRADAETYASTWAKGEIVHVTHSYTDETGNNCSFCGEPINPLPAVSVAGAGVYMAKNDTASYESYYRSSAQKSSYKAGTWVLAFGTIVNSIGKSYYLLSDGSYVAAEDFTSGTGTVPTITMTAYPQGRMEYGTSFGLKGTIGMSSGLSYVSGYFLTEDGKIVQSVNQSTTSTSLSVSSSQINSKLKFGSLGEGSYVMLIVACAKNGAMAAASYPFIVAKESARPTPATPSAPTVLSKNANSVTLKAVSGYEYSMNGTTWQSSPVFGGLLPAKTYTFYQRVAETATANASGASAGLQVTTEKADASAPSAPALASKTAYSVTLKVLEGYEYSMDGASWQKNAVFEGLSPATSYTFYQRIAATATTNASASSVGLTVVTEKADASVPAPPTLSSKTATSVTLKFISGNEYSMDGKTWQASATFNGLSPATTYTFYQRVAATSSANASASSQGFQVTTKKTETAAPKAPTVLSVTGNSVVLQSHSGYEYSKDGEIWQISAVFTGLSPVTSYTFYQRVAETATAYASPASASVTVKTVKGEANAPQQPQLVSKTDTTVILRNTDGYEYSKDAVNWQSSSVFSGLSPAKTYTFYQRVAATATTNASAPSEGLQLTTDKSGVATPSAPVLFEKTATSVTLKTYPGYEYSINGSAWQVSPLFEGLSPAKSYTFYQRVAETETTYASHISDGLQVTTKKTETPAPVAPTVVSKTAYSVTLKAILGYEYSMDGTKWQASPVFEGLSPAKEYQFYQRIAETETSYTSPASASLTVTTKKMDVPAPAAPTVESVTDKSVTLKALEGYEYSIDGLKWQKSPVFEGLSPAKLYQFYQRIAETDIAYASPAGAPLSVTTKKSDVKAPEAPESAKKTWYSVTLKTVSGYEYSMDGTKWQTSPVFEGLSPAKEYKFYQRVAETATTYASPASIALTVTTYKKDTPAPTNPTLSSKTDKTVVLKEVAGYEYSKDGNVWQKSPAFEGLSPATVYTFYQRVAETATAYASPASTGLKVTTYKSTLKAPAAPTVVEVTSSKVTLKSVGGYEYSIDGKTWQTSPAFSGLSPAKTYTFYQRIAETDTTYASAASSALEVTTIKRTVSAPSAPVVESIKDLTVTLKSDQALEYSIDGGKTWQKSAVFELDEYGVYTFLARKAETATDFASPASEKLTVEVNPRKLSSEQLNVDNSKMILSAVRAGTTVDELLAMLREGEYVTVLSANGKEVSAKDAITTGMKLCLPEGEEYLVVVKGDIDGDGGVGVFDLTAVKRQIVNGSGLNGIFLLASDVNADGNVDVFDYIAIRKAILSGESL